MTAAGSVLNVIKTGDGTLKLTHNNNLYSGSTSVNAGTLLVTGSIANSATTVAAGATVGGGGTFGDALPSGAADPEAQARAAETAARLQQAVAGLPLKQRAVFLMARYDGLAYAEIAEALRIPVGTVKSRMNKAVKTIMAQLEEGRQ